MNYQEISQQLKAGSRAFGHDFEADYVGFQKNVERALLFFLDAMFPSYRKYPELFCGGNCDVREDALEKACDSHFENTFG